MSGREAAGRNGSEPTPGRPAAEEFAELLSALKRRSRRSYADLARLTFTSSSALHRYCTGASVPHDYGVVARIARECAATPEELNGLLTTWMAATSAGPAGEYVAAPALSPAGVPLPAVLPAVSVTPPVPSARLRGRQDLVSGLLAAFENDRSDPPGKDDDAAGRVWVLHGLGGCGKTTVAQSVAYELRGRGVPVWWVSAADELSLLAGMRAVAVRAGADRAAMDAWALGREHGPDLVWEALDQLDGPWLLVVDNADEPDLLGAGEPVTLARGWLRPPTAGFGRRSAGMVLVTSRDGDADGWGPWCRLRPVTPLDPRTGGQVLVDLAGERAGPADRAEALSERLGGLPLALRLAGSYLRASLSSPVIGDEQPIRGFADYLAAFDRLPVTAVLDRPGPGEAREKADRETVARTWELSVDQLGERGHWLARPLLRLLACLGQAPIPTTLVRAEDFVTGAAGSNVVEAARQVADPSADGGRGQAPGVGGDLLGQLRGALRGLLTLGLLQRPAANGPQDEDTVMLHPLVRATVRAQPGLHADLPAYQRILVAALDRSCAGLDPLAPADWSRWAALGPHCAALLHPPGPTATISAAAAEHAHDAARYLAAAGLYEQAERELRAVLAVADPGFGASHPLTLAARHSLAMVLRNRGRFDEAEIEAGAVLELRTQALGPEHPDTLATRHYLARGLRNRGRYDEAEREFGQMLAIRTRVLGPEHPDTMVSRHSLARVVRNQGRYDEALAEFQAVHDMAVRVLGPEHPDTLDTRQYRARTLRDLGRLEESEAESRAVLALQRQVLGSDHPDTLDARLNLARVLRDQGRLDESERESHAVLAQQRRVLGPDHPDTLDARHNLALVLRDRGRTDDARKELLSVLEVRTRTLGPDHPDTLSTAPDLGSLPD